MSIEKQFKEWEEFRKSALENMLYHIRNSSVDVWKEASKTYIHAIQQSGHKELILMGDICIHQDHINQDKTLFMYGDYKDCLQCFDYSKKCYEPKRLRYWRNKG